MSSVHSRVVNAGRGLPMEKPEMGFASYLKRSYKAGQASRLQSLTREPPYDDNDLNLAWVCGYDATQREIEEWESKEVA